MEINQVTFFCAGELADVTQWVRVTPGGLEALPDVTLGLIGCRFMLLGVREITPLLSADEF